MQSRTLGAGYVLAAGAFNGDGADDLLLYRPGAATDAYWWGNATRSSFDAAFATPTSISGTYHSPLVGDVDDDGLDDIYWFAFG